LHKIKEYEKQSALPNLNNNLTLELLVDNIKSAISLERIGQFEEAISLYGKVIDVIPNEIDAMFYMANALVKIKKYEEALSWYDKLIENDPTHVGALANQKITLDYLGLHYGIAPIKRRQYR